MLSTILRVWKECEGHWRNGQCLVIYHSCGQWFSVSQYMIRLCPFLVNLLELPLQLLCSSSDCTLKHCIWPKKKERKRSESTRLDVESGSWEMALLLQLIRTSPGAFTDRSDFGSRAVGESALNSARWKMLSAPWGGLIWTPAGHSYFWEINCKIVTLYFQVEWSRQRFNCQGALAVMLTCGGFACRGTPLCQKQQ